MMVATSTREVGTPQVKRGIAQMLRGGVIMGIAASEQAEVAEDAGIVAVITLEHVPTGIRAQGGVAHVSNPDFIESIINAASIPVMAKTRIGHFIGAQVLKSFGVDHIDESEVPTPTNYAHHIDKRNLTVPFVCDATNLDEALRHINGGTAVIRSRGETGTGDVPNVTTHMRQIRDEIRHLTGLLEDELYVAAGELQAPYELIAKVTHEEHLSAILLIAGSIAILTDTAMMMQSGAEGVPVGPGIFESGDPARRAAAIVKTTVLYDDPKVIARVSRSLSEAMIDINVNDVPVSHYLAEYGW